MWSTHRLHVSSLQVSAGSGINAPSVPPCLPVHAECANTFFCVPQVAGPSSPTSTYTSIPNLSVTK